jgi:sialate O-acetylesterase
MKPLPFCAFLAGVASAVISASAEVKLPAVFTDHMVLQREEAVPVWGQAAPAENVVVEFGGQKKSTQADANGRWRIKLDAMPANAQPQTLKAGQATVQDVLVGEVWLASGQSNMEWEMGWKPETQADLATAAQPSLRFLKIPKVTALSPQDDVNAAWVASSPESAAAFSAVAYYFGVRLLEELKVPVGIVLSAWGGTQIEPWTSVEGFEAIPELKDFAANARASLPGNAAYRAAYETYLTAVGQWSLATRDALTKGQPAPLLPPQPATFPKSEGSPTALYNAMIYPLAPFAFRGTIWYQGESNHNEGFVYTAKTKALLASWRSVFQQPELPFYFVQIAPFQYGAEDPEILPQFWVAQRECLRIPHTGMAVISDLGEVADIHPGKKKEVARRLSLWALSKTYGRKEIDPSGPLYSSFAVEGQTLRVTFDGAATGLASRDGKPLTHFELAGSDNVFHPAEAKIDCNSVLLSAQSVPQPRRARFAWNKTAIPNLMDRDGLAASAFHTHWPVDPDLGDNFARGCSWQSNDQNPYGWDVGLTDGSWASYPPNAFATNATDAYPKHVTIDLKQPRAMNLIRFGVPEFGSTKTVAVSISSGGTTFREVGRHTFSLGKAEQAAVSFPEATAREIRLSYLDHHDQTAGEFPNTFSFTTEVEAYHTK